MIAAAVEVMLKGLKIAAVIGLLGAVVTLVVGAVFLFGQAGEALGLLTADTGAAVEWVDFVAASVGAGSSGAATAGYLGTMGAVVLMIAAVYGAVVAVRVYNWLFG